MTDRTGRAVPDATVEVEVVAPRSSGPGRSVRAVTDGAGNFTIPLPSAGASQWVLRAQSPSMDSGDMPLSSATLGQEVQVVLHPSTVAQEATVTATRSGFEMGPQAVTQSTLTAQQLTHYPAQTLDEMLRQHAGFELFRRSSGWVQNPTSQGISLRGLGSTAASRTLVLLNSAPLNDPFGDWIHWNELPPEAIDAVTIASGGGSDLYGSSALGGVIDIVPSRPSTPRADVTLAGAGQDTSNASARGDLQQGRWSEMLAGQDFRTAGYTLTAPASRGPIDIPANVHFQNGRFDGERTFGGEQRAFLTANLLNEARGNGVPLTTNGTRIWRYLAGTDWTAADHASGRVRLFGSDEAYRQTFTSVNADRTAANLTRVQHSYTQELGASTDASYHLDHVAFVGGADVRDIRGLDREVPTATNVLTAISTRQRFLGGFGELLGELGPWSGAASLRVDSASNLDTRIFTGTAPSRDPDTHEVVVSPRLGLVRRLTRQVSVHASGFRAFRTPTMNELYRNGQVGQELTLANPQLSSERATGAEGGVTVASRFVNWRGTYFWTEINRPVSAVLIASTPTTITNKRENLGQIQSQGVEMRVEIEPAPYLSLHGGYQYAHAVVTQFSTNPSLVGKWIPDVPRNSATAQIRLHDPRFGELTLAARNSGRAYDDSTNIYELRSYFVLDLYAQRQLGKGFTAFVSMQNLLDRSIDVARTPVLTLGTPFTTQGGIRFHWGGRSDL